jgi:hypothetical protein
VARSTFFLSLLLLLAAIMAASTPGETPVPCGGRGALCLPLNPPPVPVHVPSGETPAPAPAGTRLPL